MADSRRHFHKKDKCDRIQGQRTWGRESMRKTKIIAIEGIDGGGKGVQVRALKENLKKLGYTVAGRDYPMYDTYFGAQVGRLLSGADGVRADEIDGKSMALWFALDRWESFKDYRDGETDFLIINRFVLSNAVYQSVRDIDLGKPDIVNWVMNLEYGHFGLPKPDLNIVFSILPKAAEENVTKKGYRGYVGEGKDVYEADHGIQQRAMEKYIEIATDMEDADIIYCMEEGRLKSIDDIAKMVMDAIKRRGLI